jgi:UPF0271 protein
MEININCDLGETSKFCSTENDPLLLGIVNSANVACGYHAGDEPTMKKTVEISKKNGVSIGAHPSFNDPENFGRRRLKLSPQEITKLIIDQINILSLIAEKNSMNVTHVKPHGALNNMACENFELANVIAKSILQVNKDLIFLVPTGSEMQRAAKKLKMKVAKKHVIKMVKNQALNCFSGKQIPCDIDSVCVHGDGESAVVTAKEIRNGLVNSGVTLRPLDQLKKFA